MGFSPAPPRGPRPPPPLLTATPRQPGFRSLLFALEMLLLFLDAGDDGPATLKDPRDLEAEDLVLHLFRGTLQARIRHADYRLLRVLVFTAKFFEGLSRRRSRSRRFCRCALVFCQSTLLNL